MSHNRRHYNEILERDGEEAAKKNVCKIRKIGLTALVAGGVYLGIVMAFSGH